MNFLLWHAICILHITHEILYLPLNATPLMVAALNGCNTSYKCIPGIMPWLLFKGVNCNFQTKLMCSSHGI